MQFYVPVLVVVLLFAFYTRFGGGRPRRICTWLVDEWVPFVPVFVIPYLGLFAFVPATVVLLSNTPYLLECLLALIFASLSYAIAGPIVGCGATRADARGKGVCRALVRAIYRLDGPFDSDAFPSTHVYLSTICGYYLAIAFPPYALTVWAIAGLIAVSTVFIKQHNVLDIAGGAFFAAAAIFVAHVLAPLFS